MPSQPIWWEKTVEYRFILDAASTKDLDFAAPLSGIPERCGDGIFAKNSKIILIEFKCSKNELTSEFEKFGSNYNEAKQTLNDIDGHHFLVYGVCNDGKLDLHAQTYFSSKSSNAMDVFEHGVKPEVFKIYIEEFLRFKKPDGRSTGAMSFDSMASIFGLSSDEKTCTSISFSDYCEQALPDLYTEHESEWESPSSPSPERF
ncbi:hypothetical protein L1889_11730 [Paenalcaligenes niemegkensis]|uniref:hypothetical protein n=1 Tax=Paenalcaligenes niemegkensis TaxID=2895469 RepID=UPI001EE8A60F|nr:hypothetical protein [Paenalcaligenes niemegkensis]MCQ9617276.1 hypothetical protein [Paenalcaligenes niemegkensis]